MRDGQPPVCPRLESVSLRWENEGTGYLSIFTVYLIVLSYIQLSSNKKCCYLTMYMQFFFIFKIRVKQLIIVEHTDGKKLDNGTM